MTQVVWEHLGWGPRGSGIERLTLGTHAADGVVVWAEEEARPYRLAYRIEWDDGWQFRRVAMGMVGAARGALELRRDESGVWTRNGEAAPELAGCAELDLWPTPFTNTLPIRRLRLAPGEAETITVAHVIAPLLTVAPRPQRYTNLGGGRYRFESLDDGFSADLVVDEEGLVVDYPELFRRAPR